MPGKKSRSQKKKNNSKNTNNINTERNAYNSGYTQRYGTSASRSSRRTLPDLPKRDAYSSYGSSSYGRSTSSYSRYERQTYGPSTGSYEGRRHNSYERDIDIPISRKKQPEKKQKKKRNNVLRTAAGAVGSAVSYIGKNKQNAKIVNNKTVSAKRNRIALPIFFVFIILCFVYILGSSFNFISKDIVNYDVLSYGTIDTPKSADAVIIRSEKVYNADKAGVIAYDVADNEKVKKGSVVCSIKDEAVVDQMQESLDAINEEIMKIQSERKDISVYAEDIKKYNSQIKNIIDENAIEYAYMGLGSIYELENNLKKQLDTRNQYLLTENSDALSDLVAQRKEQENKLNENISNIAVEESGIVSYYIDGLEGEYTPENMTSLTKGDIDNTVKAQSSFRTSVSANSPAFKLVTSNIWYIASYIDSDYIEGWEKGDTRYIYIKDKEGEEHELEAYVQELTGEADAKEKFVIFRLTRDMADFIDQRNITIETESAEMGYKIPNDAIVEETLMKIPAAYVDGEGNVLKVENGSNKKVAVSVSGKDPEDENFCYTPVQLGVLNVGDTIKDPASDETFVIADVLNTKGIYIINTGLAEFRTIDLTNSVANSTHTVLDPSHNTNLYIYDRIMTDPGDVQKKDQVYE